MDTVDYFCSALSLEAHEPLYGSAPERRAWLLLEYDRPWGARVLPESTLPDAVKKRLSSWMEATPGSNVQFIRQPGASHEGIRPFVAVTDEHNPRLYGLAKGADINFTDDYKEALEFLAQAIDHYLQMRLEKMQAVTDSDGA